MSLMSFILVFIRMWLMFGDIEGQRVFEIPYLLVPDRDWFPLTDLMVVILICR